MSSVTPSTPSAMIELRGVSKRMPSGTRTLTILDAVDLSIAAGSFVAVVGPSGSGKSTLLGLMAGLDRPTEGSIHLDGHALGDLDEDALALLRRRRVGFVFQDFQLLGNLTALENVLLPLELAGVRDAVPRGEVLLARVGLSERMHHYPSQMSGGEQQRVALARAFASRPAVLFADEPTGNLDGANGRAALDLLVDLRAREGTTLVLVTHDPAVAQRAERRIHLADGRVVRDSINGGDSGRPARRVSREGGL